MSESPMSRQQIVFNMPTFRSWGFVTARLADTALYLYDENERLRAALDAANASTVYPARTMEGSS